MDQEKLLVYTDGSSRYKKKGSYAFIVVQVEDEANVQPKHNQIIYQEAASVHSPLTNIFFELLAMVKAMDHIATHHPGAQTVFATDCSANIDSFKRVQENTTHFFKNEICNQLVKKMHTLLSQQEMKYTSVEKIKGHNGDYYNHIVDRLCNAARKNKSLDIDNQFKSDLKTIMTEYYQQKTGYKIPDWFNNARQGVQFVDKQKRFNEKFDYIGSGEVRLSTFDRQHEKNLEAYAKKRQIYIVEKNNRRLRVYKKKWADYFPHHHFKPVMGRDFALFNGNLKIAEKYADCTINDDYLVKLAKNPELIKKPLPRTPVEKPHEIQKKMIQKKQKSWKI